MFWLIFSILFNDAVSRDYVASMIPGYLNDVRVQSIGGMVLTRAN